MSKKTEHEHYTEAYPKYRVDINNPANGYGGSDVVTHYAWTDQDEKAAISYDENGKLKMLADKDIEIVAGSLKPAGGVDVLIHSCKGNVEIHADENGEIRITGKNISIRADKSMLIDGGDKITFEANDIEFKGNTLRGNEIYGNLAPYRFLSRVYKGLKVGAEKIAAAQAKVGGGRF